MVGIRECVEALAQKRGIPKTEAQSIFNDVVEVLTDKIVSDGGVALKGVMTIKQKTQKGRSGNFKGKQWSTEDKQTLAISVGKDLEAKLNQ